MMRLSDTIESFIKTMLTQEEPEVELKRNELAEYFGCAPSQINYVLATRFTIDDGYVIESRRGGGGYIRIVRVIQSGSKFRYLIAERIGDTIGEVEAGKLIGQLESENLITACEADIMRSAVSSQALSVPMPDSIKDAVRAKVLKAMLTSIARKNREAQASAKKPPCAPGQTGMV
ncbi:MAG: CtsR family transcriptional regulator [Clostridiales bacterium]|nr:CtsR family transcriptional regulator [Clostridiales bacterium]